MNETLIICIYFNEQNKLSPRKKIDRLKKELTSMNDKKRRDGCFDAEGSFNANNIATRDVHSGSLLPLLDQNILDISSDGFLY